MHARSRSAPLHCAQDPLTFEAQNIGNPAVRSLMQKVELLEDAEINAQYPDHVGSRVDVVLDSGQVFHAEVLDPHGTPADPCTLGEMLARFRKLAASVKTVAACEGLLASIMQLRAAPSIEALSDGLRTGDISTGSRPA